jgi:asparagine synthase (glutamine-hydrolysing)
VRLPSRTGYAAALRESLEVATEAAVRSPSPVVAHLSGGLDSSAVAAIAQRRLRSRGEGLAAGISYSPPARVPGNDDERGRVLRLAEHLGVELQWTELTAAALQADFERDAALLPNASAVYEYLVLPGLVERGAGVVLSGWGGDEVASYSGYGHIGRLLRAGRWGTLWRDGAAIARRRGRTGARVPVSVAAQVATPVIRSVMPDRARPLFKLPPAELFDDPAAWTGVHPAAPDLRRDALRSMPAGGSPADRQAALLRHGHVTARLESWAYVGARFGVEYRFPLLDRRVIDLCLSFPPEVWVGEGYNRWVFRKAIEPDLPREVVWGDPKWEPARVANYRSLALEGWEPQVRDGMPDTAALLVRYRALLREHLRTGPTY